MFNNKDLLNDTQKSGVLQHKLVNKPACVCGIGELVSVSEAKEYKWRRREEGKSEEGTASKSQYLINQINCELFNVSEWLKINKLTLNVKKLHFIIFHNRQKKIDIVPKINIDKNQIDQIHSTKFLGVLINENLTWSDHIAAVLNKTNKNVGIIRKLNKTLPSDILLTLYNTLIAPYLDYCNIAWSSRDTIKFKKLFRVQ